MTVSLALRTLITNQNFLFNIQVLTTDFFCYICTAATIGIVGENMVVREGEANPRFNIMVMSGQLGGNVTLVYSTFNINATGTCVYNRSVKIDTS